MADDNHPFAIQLEVEFLDRLSEPVREGKARSVSEIIRTALERYNLENVVVVRPSQVMISVRLPADIRSDLQRVAREKHTSVGQLVRSAVEAFLPYLESSSMDQLEMEMPTSIAPDESAAAAPGPLAKRARKKPPSKPKARKAPRPAPKPAAKKKAKR
ncbi:MAG: ribbon-helix-helix protein, CopG family [Opitutae bacterium]|nr:ribbon-helix-helix protein, CopG family [Opitutae bacterium]